MTNEQIVKSVPAFCAAQIYHRRFTDGTYEVYASGERGAIGHLLGQGLTEDDAWKDAANNIILDRIFWNI